MTTEELEICQRLKDDFPHYASKCLKIRTKAGTIESFVLNKSQIYTHNKLQEQLKQSGKVRAIILKSRQQGLSTYIGARFYHKVSHSFGYQAFILAHESKATNNLYDMVHRYHENTPELVQPEVSKSNAKELVFGVLDSGYRLGTAENKEGGRSSTIQLLHWSEVAFSKNTDFHVKGVMQAVPNAPGTEIILESTANGVGGFFHNEWQKAESGLSDYIAIFIPWFWQDEYSEVAPLNFVPTPEEQELAESYKLNYNQLFWRRKKIIEFSGNGKDGEKEFRQEYPSCAAEAFILSGEDSYIESSIVVNARHANCEKYGPLVVGCDPARFGMDRTSIIFRQGRVAYNLHSYVKKDTMEVVGILHKIIQEHKPVKMFIDIGGLGAGIYDRLVELNCGDIVVGVNAGGKPLDANKYYNKRAEMWGLCKEWLAQEPCQIPDSDELHSDLCGIKYKFDSNSRLVMEAKEAMKKRGVRSPDTAEALILTFALPPSAILPSNPKDSVINQLASSFDAKMAALSNSRR